MTRSKAKVAKRRRSLPTQTIPSVQFELSCGATLIVSERKGMPVTAVEAHIRGGPSQDPEGLEGLAALTGGLTDQGTRRHGETEIATLLEPAGGGIQGDSGGLSGSIVSSEWKLLMSLMAEMLQEPTFPLAEVRRQKERILQRLQNEAADPRQQGALAFRRAIYGKHWLGRPAYGTLESVERIEAKHLRAHHKKHWVASRGVIAVCGDVNAEEVRAFLDRRLAKWNTGKPLVSRPIDLPSPRSAVEVIRATRKQVHVYLGHLGIRRSDPDYATLVVLDHVLGQGPGFTDRISRRLRDELGLAYSVSAGMTASAGLSPGTFTAYIGTSPEHVGTALEHFLHEVRRIQTDLVPEEELRVAKDYLIGSFSMGFERASRRANYLVSAKVHGHPADNLERLPRQFEAVTPEELRAAARKHLFPDQCCVCAAGPVRAADLKKALAKARA